MNNLKATIFFKRHYSILLNIDTLEEFFQGVEERGKWGIMRMGGGKGDLTMGELEIKIRAMMNITSGRRIGNHL